MINMVILYKHYRYKNVTLKNPRYFSEMYKKLTGIEIIITSYPATNEILVNSPKELTEADKKTLEDLIAMNPEPVSVYEYVPVDVNDFEAAVGVKPVMVDWFGERSVRVYFDKPLTPDQEIRLKRFLEGPRMKLKKVK
ncbi:MAG: hypothetical protein QW734_11310 [Candidatus Bathyarchaeia archaeon]